MKPDAIQLETLIQLLELRAELNALTRAFDRRWNNPAQAQDWRADLQEGMAAERRALFQQLVSRDATLGAQLRDFLDQEN